MWITIYVDSLGLVNVVIETEWCNDKYCAMRGGAKTPKNELLRTVDARLGGIINHCHTKNSRFCTSLHRRLSRIYYSSSCRKPPVLERSLKEHIFWGS
jgi:hypothetical protein